MSAQSQLDFRPPTGRPAGRRRSFIPYPLRLARRELRGGLGGFRVFLGCLVLGVTAIAGIGSLTAAVVAGIRADARVLLGGDVSLQLPFREANPAERRFLADSGSLSTVAKLRAMARSLDGDKRSLIELQAVDAVYPLYGAVTLTPSQPLGTAFAQNGGIFGAAVERTVASRLGLAIGDRFRVGDAIVELRAIIDSEPDAAFGGLAFGPRVLISDTALAATGLIRPGAIVNYDYRLRLSPGADPDSWAQTARAAFPEAGWQIRTGAEGAPSLQRLIDRLGFFLNLVGISALLVGGVGIGNAVSGYIASKTAAIATLKCLGASTRLVFSAYLAQILTLALAGIAAGLVLGGLTPAALAPLVKPLLPVGLKLGLYPAPLAIAAACGLLTTLAFSLWPLAAIGRIPPAALFRDRIAPTHRRIPPIAAAATVAAGFALAALVVLTAPERRIALWYVGGALAAFALFRVAGAAVVAVARRLPRPSLPALRLALANLHRPDAPTSRVVLSLGIGLSVLVAVALVGGNLATEIETRLAENAPADFFIDIQPDQLAGFAASVSAIPGARFEQVPMLRGRITRINGTPVEDAKVAPEAQWALRSDRGLTYSDELPRGSRLVAGSWWPADYKGPPLVSFDSELAHGMGLQIGDTLTVNVLGRDVTATIASLRRVEWARLGINFAIVFAPGTLEAAPQTHLAAVYVEPGEQEDALVRQITDRFPNVSAIPVREALAAVAGVVATIGTALQIVALVTLAAGVLVLGGAIAAGHRRRVYDAVVLKVLGATRRLIAAAFLIEHGLLGLATAVVAAGLGTLAAYVLVTGPMNSDWVFLPGPVLAMLGLAVLLTLALGFAGTWRALGAKPARYLRNE
ncbi:MAG TPA: FtsX-like permease family protein [Stellaceae bacterium]|nr:FtsX-like permease family protein [Stellaceae bacterium]